MKSRFIRFLRDKYPALTGVVLLLGGLAGAFEFRTYLPHAISLAAAVLGLLVTGNFLAARIAGENMRNTFWGRAGRRLWQALPVILVVLATLLVYHHMAFGKMPWCHDHAMHLFKSWHLGERLLPSGRLTGWSHYLWTGWPAEMLYPFLGDLLVVIVHKMTLGYVSWPVAYAYALLVALLVYHLGIFAVGCRWFGPWVGAVAALISLADRGGQREGGYHWTLLFGVWPMAFGTGLWFFALERLVATLEKPTRGRIAAFGLLLALALLGHPMTLMYSVVIFPMVILLHLLRAKKGRIVAPAWAVVGGAIISAALVAFWYLPFLSASEYISKSGGAWHTIYGLGGTLHRADIFAGTWRLIIVLGLVGALLVWVQRHEKGRRVSIMAGMLLFFLCIAVSELDLSRIYEGFDAMHFRRFTYPLKMLWFLLGAYALVGLIRLPAQQPGQKGAPRPKLSWRQWLWTIVAVAVFVPIVESFLIETYYDPMKTIGSEKPLDEQPYGDKFLEINGWLRKATSPDDPFFRIAYDIGPSKHLFNASPIITGRPAIVIVKDRPPATGFNRIFRNTSASTFTLQNIRFVVSTKPQYGNRKNLQEVHRIGNVHIYETKDYDPDPFEVQGRAEVECLHFGDELIRLRVRNPSAGDHLLMHVTQLDRWHASIDGTDIPIQTVQGNEWVKWLMRVPLEKEGVLEFRYVRDKPEILGTILSIIGLILAVAVFLWGQLTLRVPFIRRVSDAARSVFNRIAVPALVASGAACAIAVIVAFVSRDPDPGYFRLSKHLHEARVHAGGQDFEERECKQIFDTRFVCDYGQRKSITTGMSRFRTDTGTRLRNSLLVRPFMKLHIFLEFSGVRMHSRLNVRCGSLRSLRSAHVPMHFRADGDLIGKVKCPLRGHHVKEELDTRSWQGKSVTLTAEIFNDPTTRPLLVIDAWVDDPEP